MVLYQQVEATAHASMTRQRNCIHTYPKLSLLFSDTTWVFLMRVIDGYVEVSVVVDAADHDVETINESKEN
jgi:hypothetical protein